MSKETTMVQLLCIDGSWITAATDPRLGARYLYCVYRLLRDGKPVRYWAKEGTHYTDPTGLEWDSEGNQVALLEQGDQRKFWSCYDKQIH